MIDHHERLAAAFPASIRHDALAALTWIPMHSHRTSSPVTAHSIDGPRTPAALQVFGEPVGIPSRIYVAEPEPDVLPGRLPDTQRTILNGLPGHPPPRRIRPATPASQDPSHPQPWVVPFVVQLIGEYLVEIVTDILHALPTCKTRHPRNPNRTDRRPRTTPPADDPHLDTCEPGALFAGSAPTLTAGPVPAGLSVCGGMIGYTRGLVPGQFRTANEDLSRVNRARILEPSEDTTEPIIHS